MPLMVQESYVNETKGYRYGDSGWQEAFTDNVGRLFLSCQREFGRCVSRMYREKEGGDIRVGWVFQKRMQYEDARTKTERDFYIREVWVEVRQTPDTEA